MFNTISNQVFYTLGLYDIWNMLDNQQKETLTEAINIGIDEGIKQVKVEPEVMVNFADTEKLKEIFDEALEKIAFRVPYDGTNNFYDKQTLEIGEKLWKHIESKISA